MPTITRKAAAAESAGVNAPENETTVPAKRKSASSGNTKRTAAKASKPTSASQTAAPKSKKKEKGGSVTLSGEDYQAFLKFQQGQDQSNSPAQQKIAEKERKAQENLAIQERNRAMRDKEDHSDDDTEDNAPPAKKSKPSHTILSDDEAELSKELGSTTTVPGLPDFTNVTEEDIEDEDEPQGGVQNGEDNTDDEEEVEVEEQDGQGSPAESQASAAGDALADNGMEISTPASEKAYRKPSSKNSTAPKLEHASVSPSLSSTKTEVSSASTAKKAAPPKSSGGTKVVREQFSSPEVLALADAAKSHLRTQICFGNWKLDSDPEKPDWIWTIIAETPSALGVSSRPRATEGLKQLLSDNAEKEKVMTYVGYGKTVLFNTIVTKARSKVAGYLSLHGSVQDVTDKVTWLLQASNFLYGDLNVKVCFCSSLSFIANALTQERTFNSSKPFGNPFIKDLIQTVWFNTSKNGSKAEAMTTKKMIQNKEVPLTIILLVVTAIEHSIGEYRPGTLSVTQFRENSVRNRFMHHSSTWRGLVQKSKKWSDAYPAAVYKSIILTCGDLSYLLMEEEEVNEEEIKDVKPEDLDSIADNGMADVF
ncbi:hypothetical protein CVT26_000179 [Gymnopilus dilepis]|uniref:DUF6532 domain-containing protein n=1 Tax=Gymnopilus dilepis TaxID=231916 RepID=A0A409WW83_9AGAR|nr:hypothetical protein CVT26_000179 [Gymnopilus dilepis]